MEIEKKFLLKEKEKIFANRDFFPQMSAIKKEIKTKGSRIIQSYLPLELLDIIVKELNIVVKFKPNEIRLRKINSKYVITFKSKGKIKRSEYEKSVSKEFYKKYKNFRIKFLEKYRLKKRVKNYFLDLDYYPKGNLIVCEVEVKSKRDLNRIPKFGRDVSKDPDYSNKHLAE